MKEAHLTLRLPDELARSLELAADARGVAKSMVVREAVAVYLAGRLPRAVVQAARARDLARLWTDTPSLGPEAGDAFAKDIETARDALAPPDNRWE